MRIAIKEINEDIDSYLKHRYVPNFIRTLMTKIRILCYFPNKYKNWNYFIFLFFNKNILEIKIYFNEQLKISNPK